MTLICHVFMMISTLCPSRCSALLDITECDAASCRCVDFHLLHYTATRYCWRRTSIHVSLRSGLCFCAFGCCSQTGIGHKTDHVQEGDLYVYFLYYVQVAVLLIKRNTIRCTELILSKNKQIYNANIKNFSMEFLQNTCLLGFIGNNFPLKIFHSCTYICQHKQNIL